MSGSGRVNKDPVVRCGHQLPVSAWISGHPGGALSSVHLPTKTNSGAGISCCWSCAASRGRHPDSAEDERIDVRIQVTTGRNTSSRQAWMQVSLRGRSSKNQRQERDSGSPALKGLEGRLLRPVWAGKIVPPKGRKCIRATVDMPPCPVILQLHHHLQQGRFDSECIVEN